ncbi:hypothetical protein FA13DRAFT_726232 [Coprinellus micaceus]|uniref:Uncharacterized protein n=1 Tax=Coprinellus micaceus TaxID=71717 RepID=A0A4Y7TVD3_COPMI|nr:hypothetical protein FA13DRAFT_726232 [Coprinellus micaceus]
MASNPSIFSPSASSFLTAPSVAGLDGSGTSSPAEPDSPLLSTGSNGIVTVDSERWTSSECSEFTALSAVSSTTPSILSMNSSMPGTNGVPTAPQSPAREAVNDNVNTDNSTSIDTIRPESRWQDREKTPSRASTFSLLRYLSALPAPSGSGSDAFNSFEFPGIGQDAGSATQQQQSAEPEPSPSPFPQYPYPTPQPPTLSSAYPDPPMTSFSPPATVSTNVLDGSRQPSPAPSESVERLAANLMAFSMTSSSEEPAERHDPEGPTTSSTLTPSPPTPIDAPNVTTTTTYEYMLSTSPEPLPKPDSADLPEGQGSFSGVNPTGASIPLNATTALGGFSHSTTQRWPWMDIADELLSNQGLDAGRYDGAPFPHIMQVLPGPRPPVEVDRQQPADEAPHLFGSLAAHAPALPSMTVFSEDEGLTSGPPSALPPPYYPLPAPLWSGFGTAADTQADAVSAPLNSTVNYSSTLEQDWIQAYSVPTRPLFGPQEPAYPDAPSHSPIPTNAPGPQFGTGSFDFSLGVGDADATPRGAGLGGDSWRVGSLQAGWDGPRAPGSYGGPFGVSNDHSDHHDAVQPHLPYRVPSPSSFRSTPTPQFPPATPGQTHPPFGCPLFAPPSPSANTVSTEADSVYGLKRVTPTTQQQPSSDQGFQTSEEDEPRDKGKGRLAVNTEEARLAYERAVEARKKFRGEAAPYTVDRPFGPLFDMDGPSAHKAYQDAVQARDLLTQRYSTNGARISQSAFEQPAAPHSPTQHSDFGPPFSPVQDMSYDLHSYFPASAVPRLQTVSGPNHPTIEQYPAIQSPVASLEAIPIVPVSAPPLRRRGTPGPEQNDWKDVKQWSMEEEMASVNREINERSHVDTEKKESSHATQEFATGYPAPKYQPGGHRSTPQASPFIPPSRTSSASSTSMYVISSAPQPLQCRPPPSPTSSTTSSDAPRILPRRRSQRSIRRSTSSHTIPAVSFVLPGPTNTTQTGSPVQSTSNPIHNFQSSYPGMSSGKLSTLNFNESTRPSPWISQVPTGNTSHWGPSSGPGPMGGRSQSGFGCGFGSGGFNATPNDNQLSGPSVVGAQVHPVSSRPPPALGSSLRQDGVDRGLPTPEIPHPESCSLPRRL